MKIRKSYLFLGIILFVISLIQAFVYDWAHYYTFFSLGLFLILLEIYRGITGKDVFERWKIWQHVLFWTMLLGACIFIDAFGMDAGYWIYPNYISLFDNLLKYVFEWVIAHAYLMISFMIGIEVFRKYFGYNKVVSFFASIIVFSSIIGVFTEGINLLVDSWVILDVPLWNFKIGEFFVMFQTFGYWVMSVFPYLLYNLVGGFGE